jgi:dimethylhistidine N-methyltransferase
MKSIQTKTRPSSRQWPSRSASSPDFAEYLAGLKRSPKRLPSKFFYDAEGSRLFERICLLDEYYLTRAETEILETRAHEIAALVGEGAAVVELGSGSDRKIRLLLKHLKQPSAYVPVDIDESVLDGACESLRADFPELKMRPVQADYTNGLMLPDLSAGASETLVFFPGSTLGNMEPIEALAFLEKVAGLAGRGAAMLIGVDLRKERTVLEAAYNDREGVTAEFNKNILARANRDFGADFDLGAFEHRAFFDEPHRRVVMQLESTKVQQVHIGAERISFGAGERITTEYSYKYTVGEFEALARLAGFSPRQSWTDGEKKFGVHLLKVS